MDETPPLHRPWSTRTWPTHTWEVFQAFLGLGLTAFGGPVAHLSYFRREFVERRGWLSEAAFADLLALAQFLPGPASSQLGMAIGLRRAGYLGLAAAWLGFTLPAGAAMIALAYAAPYLTATWGKGFLHGLQIGLAFLREPAAAEPPDDPATHRVPVPVSVAALSAFVLLLGLLPVLAASLDDPTLGLASVFYRAGALVFGGGHVVLPLLQSEIVGRGWLDQDSFLGGYGVVQALPGPLFSFAGFVGAAQQVAPGGWPGGLVALVAIFLPGLLLVLGVLPFWDRLKRLAGARGALAGVNAVVVGVLAAALWDPVLTTAMRRPSDWALAAGAYVFLAIARLPPWLVVIGFAALAGVFSR